MTPESTSEVQQIELNNNVTITKSVTPKIMKDSKTTNEGQIQEHMNVINAPICGRNNDDQTMDSRNNCEECEINITPNENSDKQNNADDIMLLKEMDTKHYENNEDTQVENKERYLANDVSSKWTNQEQNGFPESNCLSKYDDKTSEYLFKNKTATREDKSDLNVQTWPNQVHNGFHESNFESKSSEYYFGNKMIVCGIENDQNQEDKHQHSSCCNKFGKRSLETKLSESSLVKCPVDIDVENIVDEEEANSGRIQEETSSICRSSESSDVSDTDSAGYMNLDGLSQEERRCSTGAILDKKVNNIFSICVC